MKNYLLRNYYETKAKYEKFRRRLDHKVSNGSFKQLSYKKQRQLIDRIKKLFKKLKELQLTLKLGTVGATMALTLLFGNATGQKLNETNNHHFFKNIKHHSSLVQKKYNQYESELFKQVRGINNPFGGTNPFDGIITYTGWANFADLDGDGDFDVIIGTSYDTVSVNIGEIEYYKNNGDNQLAKLENLQNNDNPFIDFQFEGEPTIKIVDIDNDGDVDLFAIDAFSGDYGIFYKIRFFKNSGTANNPQFEEQTGTDNPFDSIQFDYPKGFTFVDIDGDLDMDMFISDVDNAGYYSGQIIKFFKNTGSQTSPVFEELTGTENPINISSSYYESFIPVFADIDGDGDFDAIISSPSSYYNQGNIHYLKNNGTAIAPDFEEQFGTNNPFENIKNNGDFNAKFTDIDLDNDLDILVSSNNGEINYFENTGSASNPEFTDRNGINLTMWAFIDFADLDADGDLDLVAGTVYNYDATTVNFNPVVYYKNIGTSTIAKFEMQTGNNDPFNGLIVDQIASFPIFVDLDNDGDYDFFNFEYSYYGKGTPFTYYKNTGTPESPEFTKQTGIDNPLSTFEFDNFAFVNFADIDNDGDLDCFIGNYIETSDSTGYGILKYFRNTGTAENAVFEEATSPIPRHFMDNYLIKPEFSDIDMDGDLDCIIATYEGYLYDVEFLYFKNNGTSAEPQFIEQTGIDNPFSRIVDKSPNFLYPAMADIDNDGDDDLMLGTYSGSVLFYKNTTINTGIIKNKLNNELIVYPNPASTLLKIKLDNNIEGVTSIELFDYLGKKIETLEQLNNETELDVSYLTSGIYFIKITQGDKMQTAKFMKR